MKQQCQNVRSTKVKQNAMDNQDKEDQNKPQAKLKDLYVKIYLANDTFTSIKQDVSRNVKQRKQIHNGVS